MERMKIKMLIFPQNVACQISQTPRGIVKYMYVKRRKTSVLVTPVEVREQRNASVIGGKTVASEISHAQCPPAQLEE